MTPCHHPTRRTVLGGLAAGTVAALAGCVGGSADSDETPDPVSLSGSRQCDVCGMAIDGSFGPNGQTFFESGHPQDRDGPAWYDSVRELFVDSFGRDRQNDRPVATYVTDYATVTYEVQTGGGDRYISSSVRPESFVAARDAVFVVESGVEGAMGAELLPFGDRGRAENFVSEYAGRVVEYDAVTPELVRSL